MMSFSKPPENHPKSFDPDFPVDHAELIENQVVERYLTGRLPREEAERFEQHFLDCPTCLELLEVTEAMLDGFRHNAARDAIKDAAADSARPSGVEKPHRLSGRSDALRAMAALAAGLLMVIAVGAGWTHRQLGRKVETLESRLAQIESPHASPVEITLSPLRDAQGANPSSAATRRLHLPKEPRWLWLTLELGLTQPDRDAQASYRLEMREGSGQVIWQSDDLLIDSDGHLKAGIPSTFLADVGPGDVTLSVESSSDGIVASFPFKIVH